MRFERHFSLADHVEVAGATFESGLLQIDLVRKVPEAMKPRRVNIGTGQSAANEPKVLEHEARDTKTTRCEGRLKRLYY